jgi:hypothetical protein
MDFFNSFFSELLSQYGLYTTIGVVAILYVLRDLWLRYAKKLFGRKKVPLKDHSAFRQFDRLIEHTLVNDFHCSCPIRKAIYSDILIEMMKCFKNKLLEFVNTDLNNKDAYPTQHDFYLKIVSIIEDVHLESKKRSIANGVPEFVLDTLEDYRMRMKRIADDMLKVVCYSEYRYATNVDRMHEILSYIVVFSKHYMNMLEEVLASYNGNIKNLEYKGISCKGCRVCIHDEYVKKMRATLSK